MRTNEANQPAPPPSKITQAVLNLVKIVANNAPDGFVMFDIKIVPKGYTLTVVDKTEVNSITFSFTPGVEPVFQSIKIEAE
jgi:hypothetical protein